MPTLVLVTMHRGFFGRPFLLLQVLSILALFKSNKNIHFQKLNRWSGKLPHLRLFNPIKLFLCAMHIDNTRMGGHLQVVFYVYWIHLRSCFWSATLELNTAEWLMTHGKHFEMKNDQRMAQVWEQEI